MLGLEVIIGALLTPHSMPDPVKCHIWTLPIRQGCSGSGVGENWAELPVLQLFWMLG
jgi:hypothetical protein